MDCLHAIDVAAHGALSVVVNNFNIFWAGLCPDKAHAELIIDADAVLTLSASGQSFEPVSWRGSKEFKRQCGIEHRQLPDRDTFDGS
jgi:hypothetical protein